VTIAQQSGRPSKEHPYCAVSVVLKALESSGQRGSDGFQDFENEAGEGKAANFGLLESGSLI